MDEHILVDAQGNVGHPARSGVLLAGGTIFGDLVFPHCDLVNETCSDKLPQNFQLDIQNTKSVHRRKK